MPNTKSAAKRLRQSAAAHGRNSSARTRISSLRRLMMESLRDGDGERGREVYRQYCSALDKAAKGGSIGKNTAQRRKARAANRLRTINSG